MATNRSGAGFRGLPVELMPLLDVLPRETLETAAVRALAIGVSAEQVLFARGDLGVHAYAEAAARWLGVAQSTLAPEDDAALNRMDLPAPDAATIRAGFVPLEQSRDGTVFAAVARGDLVANIARFVDETPRVAGRLRLTTPDALRMFVLRHSGQQLATEVAFGLAHEKPELSAGVRGRLPVAAMVVGAALLALAIVEPGTTLAAMHIILSSGFLAWIALRLLALLAALRRAAPRPRFDDAALPVYTLLVPLYREAAMAAGLASAMQSLDYPPEKLDIKLIVESDDLETRAALAALDLPSQFDIVVAPQAGPRTKPKALRAAMLFARGDFIVVYDAEDRPDPEQLKLALAAFARGGARLGCVQARLAVDNARDGWLTRLFAAEYAGLFDVLLPMLVALGLPIPLGGTSNHFRRAALESVGSWDPHNVTEDADLGIRLARSGWRTDMIASTTWEEAPRGFGSWLRQRTRWNKGWIQTWLVHMRAPRRLLAELGALGFVTFQLMVGGTVLSALVHPLFIGVLVAQIAGVLPTLPIEGFGLVLAGLAAATLVSGYLASAALGLVGLSRRRLLSTGWALVGMPLYWPLLSIAAWRGVWQLLRDPYRWEKTEHGIARTSLHGRAGPAPGTSSAAITNVAEDRPPPHPADA